MATEEGGPTDVVRRIDAPRRPAFGRKTEPKEREETRAAEPPMLRPIGLASPSQPPTPPSPSHELRALCLSRIDPGILTELSAEEAAAEIQRLVGEIAAEARVQLNAREERQFVEAIANDILGLGPLQPLLEDDTVSDILVNGPERIYVERDGRLVPSGFRFRDQAHVVNVAQRVAAAVGRRIDEASPMVDARLADGSRVNIVFPPIALDGPCISIRKFARRRIDLRRMIELGSLTPAIARLLELAGRARLNILISGGTGTGKTTLLNAIGTAIDPSERVVTIEDTAELQLPQPHVVRLETRPPNLEGRGEIAQRVLVRNALRMRPDRIIVGECRGEEAFDMLQAMNTGHDGGMTTVHANSARDALVRIENMVQLGYFGLPSRAIRAQIVSALDLVVHLERHRDGVRRIVQICDVTGLEGETIELNEIVSWKPSDAGVGGRWELRPSIPSFVVKLARFGLEYAWTGLFAGEASP